MLNMKMMMGMMYDTTACFFIYDFGIREWREMSSILPRCDLIA